MNKFAPTYGSKTFLISFALAPAVLAFLIGVINSFAPNSTVAFYLLFMAIEGIWSAIMLGMAFEAILGRKWRQATYGVLFLLLSLPVMVFLISPFVGDYVHFLTLYPYYRAKVDASPDRALRPISFYWGPSGIVSAETEKWLVYDVTGHATDVARNFSEFTDVSARRLMGNFYIVQASW